MESNPARANSAWDDGQTIDDLIDDVGDDFDQTRMGGYLEEQVGGDQIEETAELIAPELLFPHEFEDDEQD